MYTIYISWQLNTDTPFSIRGNTHFVANVCQKLVDSCRNECQLLELPSQPTGLRLRLRLTLNNAVGAQFVRCNKIKLKFETTTANWQAKGSARLLLALSFSFSVSVSVFLALSSSALVCACRRVPEYVCVGYKSSWAHSQASSFIVIISASCTPKPPPPSHSPPRQHLLHFSAASSSHFAGNYDKTVITFICCWQHVRERKKKETQQCSRARGLCITLRMCNICNIMYTPRCQGKIHWMCTQIKWTDDLA